MARRLFRKGSVDEGEEPAVNLTPLIDVVFVILIMFIVVAPMLELENIELAAASASPQATHALTKEQSPVNIQVFADDKIQINKMQVSPERLGDLLLEAKKLYPTVIPQLYYDKRATFGTYQTVKNAVEFAGFEELDLVLQPSALQ